jgi:hypothetical protein
VFAGLQLQIDCSGVYFPAFTAPDRLSVWIGDDHIRSFGRKEDRRT